MCPLYDMEDSAHGVFVYCRGADGVDGQRLRFANGYKADRWKTRHCRSDCGWRSCPYAAMRAEIEREEHTETRDEREQLKAEIFGLIEKL